MNIYHYSSVGILSKRNDWVFIGADKSIVQYYTWVLKRHGVVISPVQFPHITVVAGKYEQVDVDPAGRVEFSYGTVFTDEKYYWLEVSCPWLHEFRKENGLNPNLKFDPHLTLGKLDVGFGRKTIKP